VPEGSGQRLPTCACFLERPAIEGAVGARLALVLFPTLLLVGGTAHAASAQPVAAVELLEDTLTNWSSNLPVVIINTSGQEIVKATNIGVSIRLMDAGKGRARLTGAADLDGRAQIHLHGHTSLRYPKRSHRLKLCDPEAHPRKASLLGLPESSDWILYAPYPDKTLMRDVLAYELSNQMGRYAPRTRFVELFLNHSGAKLSPRHYMGVFVLEEKIKRAKERLPLEKLGLEDNAEPAITGGYIFKKDHLDPIDVGPPNIGGFPNSTGPPPILRPGFPTGPGGFPGDPQGFLPPEGGTDANSRLFFSRGERLLEGREGFASPHGSVFLYVEPKAEEITQAQRRWLGPIHPEVGRGAIRT
jgi:CotH kinase protein